MKVTGAFHLPEPAPWSSAPAGRRLRLPPPKPGVSPCADCFAMCCYTVVVESDRIEGDEDLERLGRRLDYDGMVLWVESSGTYVLGILTPCRFLGRSACECTVHQRPDQPRICRSYDPTGCWYRNRAAKAARGRLRVDAAMWPDFRRHVDWDARQNRLRGIPAGPNVVLQDRSMSVPATLAFQIPEDTIEDPAGLGDLLYFYSNFERVSLCRTAHSWFLLYETLRDRDRAACEIEAGLLGIDRDSAPDRVRPGRADVQRLARELGSQLFRLGPEDLANHLGAT